jgi:hypothetical protein
MSSQSSSATGPPPDFAGAVEKAWGLYKRNPCLETGGAVARTTSRWVLHEGKPSFGPALATFDVLIERRHVHYPWLLGFPALALRLLLLKNYPGWNDYYMVRWQLTGDRAALEEIHRRCQHVYDKAGWSAVWQTAQWMTSSYRKQDPQFDAAMQAVERECGCLR